MKSPAYSHKSIERNQLQKPKKAVNMATPLHHRPHRLLLSTETSTPPTNGSRTRSSNNISYSEANFDTNMVIILAALLCALICALGLNLIVRWALRCSRRFAFESAEEAAARLAATGLKKSALRQISVVIYGATGGMNMIATDCAICLGEFVDGDKVRVLPRCNHGFHVRCIDTWLGSHSSCPTCRHSLLDQPFPPPPPPSSSSDSADADAVIVRSDHGHDHLPMSADEVG